MKIILNKNKLLRLIKAKKNLGFVPTMGGIHFGHISLIKKSISQCDMTIVSIFINKPQFNRKKDFKMYPRVLSKDIAILKKLKIDFLYLPSVKQIYPKGVNKKIKISSFSKKLCGKFRPGHFKAVVDVIDRFIKIIRPQKIYLGEKDYQQYKIIESFVSNNHPFTKVILCKTQREKSGIAYSSRNFLLSKKDKKIASQVYKLLKYKKNKLIKNKFLLNKTNNKIKTLGVSKIEYLKILNIRKIVNPYRKGFQYRIFISYYINGVRLIDNF